MSKGGKLLRIFAPSCDAFVGVHEKAMIVLEVLALWLLLASVIPPVSVERLNPPVGTASRNDSAVTERSMFRIPVERGWGPAFYNCAAEIDAMHASYQP